MTTCKPSAFYNSKIDFEYIILGKIRQKHLVLSQNPRKIQNRSTYRFSRFSSTALRYLCGFGARCSAQTFHAHSDVGNQIDNIQKCFVREERASSSRTLRSPTRPQVTMWTRYRLDLSYVGHAFHGSAEGNVSSPSVLSCLRQSLSSLVGADNVGDLQHCSRTDAGVHALHNVAHCDIRRRRGHTGQDLEPFTSDRLRLALEAHVRSHPRAGGNVEVLRATRVDSSWNARRGVAWKTYAYRFAFPQAKALAANRSASVPSDWDQVEAASTDSLGMAALEKQRRQAPPRGRSPLFASPYSWFVDWPLDTAAMQAAAAHLTGTQDFAALQSSGCESLSTIKTMFAVDLQVDAPPAAPSAAARPLLGASLGAAATCAGRLPADAPPGSLAAAKAAVASAAASHALPPGAFFAGVAPALHTNTSSWLGVPPTQGATLLVRGDAFMYKMVRTIAGESEGQAGGGTVAAATLALHEQQSLLHWLAILLLRRLSSCCCCCCWCSLHSFALLPIAFLQYPYDASSLSPCSVILPLLCRPAGAGRKGRLRARRGAAPAGHSQSSSAQQSAGGSAARPVSRGSAVPR